MSYNENQTPFEFESIKIIHSSEDGKPPIELKLMVSDLDIFEHLDKPYLTAIMAFQDNSNIMNGGDVRGGDKVEIKIQNNSNTNPSRFVDKVFRIDKVMSATRVDQNQNDESIVLHLIENHWYESNARNVNQSYSGKVSEILPKISSTYIDKKEVQSTGEDIQDVKVIVPNMTPIESMCWLKNRTTTKDGYPFYLYSSLLDNILHFKDLKTMMSEEPWNKGTPHSHISSNQGLGDVQMRRTIKTYEYKNTDNLLTLINKGLVGAKHQYFNVTESEMSKVKFDIQKDVIKTFNIDGISDKNPLYSEGIKVAGKQLNTMESRVTTQISSTLAYGDDKNSYNESKKTGDYKKNVMRRTMLGLMSNSPMTVTVNGFDFANGIENTIGSVMRISFLLTSFSQSSDKTFDPKRSGDYLVYSAKHSFKYEGYDVSLTCMKLNNDDFKVD